MDVKSINFIYSPALHSYLGNASQFWMQLWITTLNKKKWIEKNAHGAGFPSLCLWEKYP